MPGEECDLCMICNQDAGEWTEYVTGYLNEDQVSTRIIKVDDTDLFPTCVNSLVLDSVLSAKAVVVFVSPGHLDLLVNNVDSNYEQLVRDPAQRGVLFMLGVDENDISSEDLASRFGNYDKWNKFDNNKHHELVLKIVDIIEHEDMYIDPLEERHDEPPQRPPATSIHVPKVKPLPREPSPTPSTTSLTDSTKAKKKRRPGYDKVELWQFQVLPYEVSCEEPTPVVLSFSQPLPVDVSQIEVILQGQVSEADTIKREVEKLNPHTLHFETPEHPEGEVTMRIMMDGQCIGVETLVYRSAITPLLGLHSFYLHLLDSFLQLVKDKVPHYALDEAANSVFNDDNHIPVQTFESIFSCYESIPSENSEYETPTLLHVGAKYGLKTFSSSLMDLPAASFAHSVTNCNTKYPEDIARENNFLDMADTFVTAREEEDLQEVVGSLYEKVMSSYVNIPGQTTAKDRLHALAPPDPAYSQVPSPLPHSSPRPQKKTPTASVEDDENYMDMTGHQAKLAALEAENSGQDHDYEPVDPTPPVAERRVGRPEPTPPLADRKAGRPHPTPPLADRKVGRPTTSKFSFSKADTSQLDTTVPRESLLYDDPDDPYLKLLGGDTTDQDPRQSTTDTLRNRPVPARPCSPTSSEEGYEPVLDAVKEFHDNQSRYAVPIPAFPEEDQGAPPHMVCNLYPHSSSLDNLDVLSLRPGFRSPLGFSSQPVSPRSHSPVDGRARRPSDVCLLEVAPPLPKREPRRGSACPPPVEDDDWYSEIPPANFPKKPQPDNRGVLSKSQRKLIDIMDMVKNGDISQSQAEIMFSEWKQEFSEGNTGSFKEKKEFLKKLSADFFPEDEPAYADDISIRGKQHKHKPGLLNRIKMSFRPSQAKPKGPTAPKKAVGVATKSTGSQPEPSTLETDESQYLALEADQRTSTLSNGSSGSRGSTMSHDSGQDSTGFESGDDHLKSKDSLGVIPEGEACNKRTSLRANVESHRRTPPPDLPPRLSPRPPLPEPEPEPEPEEEEEVVEPAYRKLPPIPPQTPESVDPGVASHSQEPQGTLRGTMTGRRLPPPPPAETGNDTPSPPPTTGNRRPSPGKLSDLPVRQPAPTKLSDQPVRQPAPAKLSDQPVRQPSPIQPPESAPRQPAPINQPGTLPRQPTPDPLRPAQHSPIPSPRRQSVESTGGGDRSDDNTQEGEPTQTQPEEKKKNFMHDILNVKLRKTSSPATQPSVARKPSFDASRESKGPRPGVSTKPKPTVRSTTAVSTEPEPNTTDSPFGPRVKFQKKVPPPTQPKPKP